VACNAQIVDVVISSGVHLISSALTSDECAQCMDSMFFIVPLSNQYIMCGNEIHMLYRQKREKKGTESLKVSNLGH